MNVPNIVYNLLSISTTKTQKGRPHSITQHFLIKLLIERSLRDVSQMSWDEFVKVRWFRANKVGPAEPTPSQEWENLERLEPAIEPSSSGISLVQNVPTIEENSQGEALLEVVEASTGILHKS